MKLKDLMNEYGEYEVKEEFIKSLKNPKPRLSNFEYFILICLDPSLKFIARDEDGNLYAYECKPRKRNPYWGNDRLFRYLPFDKDFLHFITWEDPEPVSIKELIKEYEDYEDSEVSDTADFADCVDHEVD